MANRKRRWEKEAAILKKEEHLKQLFSQEKNKLKRQEEARKLLITYQRGWFKNRNKFSKEIESILVKEYKIEYLKSIRELYNKPVRSTNKVLIINILKHPKLLYCSAEFMVLLLEILKKIYIIRGLSTWKVPKSIKEETIFRSLFMHLFVRYPISKCVEREISLKHSSLPLEWRLNLATGKGVHQLKMKNFPINGKGNFHFNNAPSIFDFYEALWWGKIKSMKASDQLAHCIIGQLKPNKYNDWLHWVEDFIFFVNKYDIHSFGLLKQVFNFILYQRKHRAYQIKLKEERYVIVPPIYENYSLKGRTIASVKIHMTEWYKQIKLFKEKGKNAPFPEAPFSTFGSTIGSIRLLIKPISNFRELAEEGRVMKHCVYEYYSEDCAKGESFIYSLKRSNGHKVMKRVATIELTKDKDKFRIGEFYAKANSTPPDYAITMVKKWAAEKNIDITGNYYLNGNE